MAEAVGKPVGCDDPDKHPEPIYAATIVFDTMYALLPDDSRRAVEPDEELPEGITTPA